MGFANEGRTAATVLVVDDDELIRRGIAAILSEETDLCVCGTTGDEASAVLLLEQHRPDVLLLDLSLGYRDGLQFLKDIAGRFPAMRIVALCNGEDSTYRGRALGAGAIASVTKHGGVSKLRRVMREITHELLRKSAEPGFRPVAAGNTPAHSGAQEEQLATLTDRELHVFHLIGAGLGTTRIAEELGISRKTVETYREHIKLKLGYRDAEALRKGAIDWRRLSPGKPDQEPNE